MKRNRKEPLDIMCMYLTILIHILCIGGIVLLVKSFITRIIWGF